jgi:hypothetical protein
MIVDRLMAYACDDDDDDDDELAATTRRLGRVVRRFRARNYPEVDPRSRCSPISVVRPRWRTMPTCHVMVRKDSVKSYGPLSSSSSSLTFFFFLDTLNPLKMMVFFNGKERTVTDVCELLGEAGWKLTEVYRDGSLANMFGKVIAVPN